MLGEKISFEKRKKKKKGKKKVSQEKINAMVKGQGNCDIFVTKKQMVEVHKQPFILLFY